MAVRTRPVSFGLIEVAVVSAAVPVWSLRDAPDRAAPTERSLRASDPDAGSNCREAVFETEPANVSRI
jgi:hypothetical protein